MSKAQGKTREEIINSLAERIDRFEKYSTSHSQTMAHLASLLAKRFGLSSAEVAAVKEAARLHDIGLYAMSPAYHQSPTALRFEERLDLWRHSIIGEQEMAKREFSRHAQLLVRWHHEWWNGTGYPDMLAFEDIPIGARILRAVELYNALTSERPYRAALGPEKEALDALTSSAGIECDPYVVYALVALLEEMRPPAPVFEPRGEPVHESPTPTDDVALASSIAEQRAPAEASVWSPTQSPPAPQSEDSAAGLPQMDQPASRTFFTDPQHQPAASPESEAPPPAVEAAPRAAEVSVADVSIEDSPYVTTKLPADQASEQRGGEPESRTPAPRPLLPVIQPPGSDADISFTVSVDESPRWRGWMGGGYNHKSLLAFEASVLRQIPFDTIAVAVAGEAKLDWYLKVWGKRILSNDTRVWAATAARAIVEGREPLDESHINQLLRDVYVPGNRLSNPALRRWFNETDCWWMENLSRNIATLEDDNQRAQALLLGMQTGDYARSFNDETIELRRPLAAIFWRLAGRLSLGNFAHPHNRVFNLAPHEFIHQARADLLYLNLPVSQHEKAGTEARSGWRECWVTGSDEERVPPLPPQTRQAYLTHVDRLLRAATHIRKWAIGCQEIGLTSAREIAELVKEYRPVRATYSKDVTEVAGGLRSYIIVAEK